ncbi:hypothetical protein L7F22_064685 [Adiantum nelumboides]|nr:hypothetical protein [Adiantum nelumboides]
MPTYSLQNLGFLDQVEFLPARAKNPSLHYILPGSNAAVLQIFLIILISTFTCISGFQDAPSSSHVGVKADDAKLQTHQGSGQTAQLPGVDILEGSEDEKTWEYPDFRHCKCGFSTEDDFAYLFQLICLSRDLPSRDSAKIASANEVRNSAETEGIVQKLSSSSCLSKEADFANGGSQQPLPPSDHEEACANEEPIVALDEPKGDSVNITDATEVATGNNASQILISNLSNIVVRQEPGGGPYNYASAVKGAKILASSKEAKGASNILNGDKDKYLHIPCSASNKYVILELSEETLVFTVAIANHEFYSSNLRVFELWGSLVYPTDNWTNLGTFEAENVRTLQTFQLNEPQWVRYLKLVIVSHFGSDFYCTISVLEVHGVDAIERMLEDWIAEDRSTQGTLIDSSPQEERMQKNERNKNLSTSEMAREAAPAKSELIQVNTSKDSLTENVKGPSDSKGGSDLKEELDEKRKKAQEVYDRDLADIYRRLNAQVSELEELKSRFHRMESRWVHEKLILENNLRSQVTTLDKNMELYRTHLKNMENKEIVALAIALLAILTSIALQISILCVPLLKISTKKSRRVSNYGSCRKIVWFVPLGNTKDAGRSGVPQNCENIRGPFFDAECKVQPFNCGKLVSCSMISCSGPGRLPRHHFGDSIRARSPHFFCKGRRFKGDTRRAMENQGRTAEEELQQFKDQLANVQQLLALPEVQKGPKRSQGKPRARRRNSSRN